MLPDNIFHRFLGVVACAPEKIAIVDREVRVTYSELASLASYISSLVTEKLNKRQMAIGYMLDKNVTCVATVLSIWGAGNYCVPLNPKLTGKDLARIIKEAEIKLLLTTTGHVNQLQLLNQKFDKNIDIIILNDVLSRVEPTNPSFLPLFPNDIAYILYTSGSSGKPKGVRVNHQSLAIMADAWDQVYGLGQGHKTHLQMANYFFDVFFADLIRALCFGDTLVICSYRGLLNQRALYRILDAYQVNIAEFVPFVLRRLVRFAEEHAYRLDHFDILICGSDRWTIREYKKTQALMRPDARLINSYGMTEASIDSTYFESMDIDELGLQPYDSVPIGWPFPGVCVEVLYIEGNTNEKCGELCVIGETVAGGYIDTSLNANKFLLKKDKKMYRTGDLVKFVNEKYMQLICRIDNEVKVRGCRVDLHQIEEALNMHPMIEVSMVCQVRENNDSWLEAFIISQYKNHLRADTLKRSLLASLPTYMIPKYFSYIEKLPLSDNGKIMRCKISDVVPMIKGSMFASPVNEYQRKIITILQCLFGFQRISMEDDIFVLGLSEEKVNKLVNAINGEFDVKIKWNATLSYCKVKQLADFISDDVCLVE